MIHDKQNNTYTLYCANSSDKEFYCYVCIMNDIHYAYHYGLNGAWNRREWRETAIRPESPFYIANDRKGDFRQVSPLHFLMITGRDFHSTIKRALESTLNPS